jgi:CO/xanthine dehydrogenase FAD-binding subunit
MIIEYHRPNSLEEAIQLLQRAEVRTVPMGGGSILSAPSSEPVAVVDLQGLNLHAVRDLGNFMEIEAGVTLQALLETPKIQSGLIEAIQHEAAYNLRQVATVAGALVSASGRSPFGTAMLALDAALTLQPGGEQASLGEVLSFRGEFLRGKLITQVTIPLNARLACAYVARSPADLPIVWTAVATWPSGRTRLALGGFGSAPKLAMDGPEMEGAETAAEDAYASAGDEWATAKYRREAAKTLTRRCLEILQEV